MGQLCRVPGQPLSRLAHKYLGGTRLFAADLRHSRRLEAGTQFYNALSLIKRVVNLGDAKSLACHPASTTHRQMSLRNSARPA